MCSSNTLGRDFWAFTMGLIPQSLFLSTKHFIMYILCLFSFSANWVMFCTVSWRLAIHYLSSVEMHICMGGNFLQSCKVIGLFTSHCRELFKKNINFLYIFSNSHASCFCLHTFSVLSILSCEKIVYLKLERALQPCLLFLFFRSVWYTGL